MRPSFPLRSGPATHPPLRRPWLALMPAALLALSLLVLAAPRAFPAALALPLGRVAASNSVPVAGASTSELAARFEKTIADARADLQVDLGAGTNLPVGATSAEAIEYRALLQWVLRTSELSLGELKSLELFKQRQRELDQKLRSAEAAAGSPPYSVLLMDEWRDAVQSLQVTIAAGDATLEFADGVLADSRATLLASEERLRLLGEKLERAVAPADLGRLHWEKQLEQIRSRAAVATAAWTEARRRVVTEERALARQQLTFYQRRLALAAGKVYFPRADLDRVLAGLDAEQRGLEAEVAAAEVEFARAEAAVVQVREKPAATQAAADRAELELRETQVETARQRLVVLRQLTEGASIERTVWEMRHAFFGTTDLAKLQTAYRRLARIGEQIDAVKQYVTRQSELALNQVTAQQNRLQKDPAAPFGSELLASLQQRVGIYDRARQGMDRRQRLVLRWKEHLDLDRGALPFTARVADLFTSLSGFATKLWQFELVSVEDTITVDGQRITGKRGVTVGKIVLVLLILVAGYWLAGFLARLIERLAIRRLKVEPNQAKLIYRWVRLLLLICLLVFSLVSVKIPLTVFAFAGGALAIGLGFGMQNLLKNFISGIIILFERPFRVGDVLDVGGQHGTLTTIGIRSSVIQRWDYTETIIPNSLLLENNVTNWTYSNRYVRFIVNVGVAYGSDTRLVGTLLNEVAERHGLIQKEPKPQVLFTEFGDSALVFELRYWVDVLQHNAAMIGSDLRHMIAGAFTERGIEISFPQRDVHLRAAAPLQVQVLPPRSDATPGAGNPRPGP